MNSALYHRDNGDETMPCETATFDVSLRSTTKPDAQGKTTMSVRAAVLADGQPFSTAALDWYAVGATGQIELAGPWRALIKAAQNAGAKTDPGDPETLRIHGCDYAKLVELELAWADFVRDLATLGGLRLANHLTAQAKPPAEPRRRRGRR
jgi:hypothetical protein